MKRILPLLIVVLLASCKQTPVKLRECGNLVCTENFASVTIEFVKDGEPIDVKDYSAVNQRTGDTLSNEKGFDGTVPGIYVVADDNDLKKLSEDGDNVLVSGTDEVSGEIKTTILKISGGKCACHVDKISGVDQVSFDE